LVKSKSSPKLVRTILSDNDDLVILRRRIAERKDLIRDMNNRSKKKLLSLEQQLLLDQAIGELEVFQEQLEQSQRTIVTQTEPKPKTINEADDYFQQLKELHEKHDRLNDKLNWLRTLVRAGDIKQLQELVRSAKI
jgi:hypothetical protein